MGKLIEAQELLASALAEEPDDAAIRADLAWTYYRANDFARAAATFEKLPDSDPMVAKLRSFSEDDPYELSGPEQTVLPFLLTDPLPVVRLAVEEREICALIDTGGAELILDTEFAAEIGASRFGAQEGIFAGGKRAAYEHGRVERVTLGEIELRRVPVHVLPTRRFSPITAGRHQIDAIIGTNLLAQFRVTLDYPAGRLVLERPAALKEPEGTEVPFITIGDHYMISDQGWLNGAGPLRFFVDSGLAGGAFTCPERTLKAAGIALPETAERGGVGGGGGPVATGVFPIDELGLGPLRQRNLTGIFFEQENGAQERKWDGLISHGFLRKYRWTIDPQRSVFIFS